MHIEDNYGTLMKVDASAAYQPLNLNSVSTVNNINKKYSTLDVFEEEFLAKYKVPFANIVAAIIADHEEFLV